MPLTKILISDSCGATGLTLYHRVWRHSDGYGVCVTHSAYEATPTDPKIPATEIGTTGLYMSSYNGLVFTDGAHSYDLTNVSLVQYAGGGYFEIDGDAIVTEKAIKDQTDLIVSGGATATGVSAVETKVDTSITNIGTAITNIAGVDTKIDTVDTNVDTTLTRLTATRAGYLDNLSVTPAPASTALTNATWTDARAGYLDELGAANIPADVDTLKSRLSAARAGYLDNLSAGAAALAAVCTEARLAELDATNIPADVDTLIARLTALRAGYLDNLSVGAVAQASVCTETRLAELAAANLPADIDTLLTRVHSTLPTFPSDPADESDLEGHIATSEAAVLAGINAWPGSGSISVDEDTGGTHNLKYIDSVTGAGIANVHLYAFLTTDWAAGNRDLRNYPTGYCYGRAITDSNGEWVNPMALAAGAYTIYAEDSNLHTFTPVAVTVA